MKKMKIIAPLIALGAVMALTSCGDSTIKKFNLLCLHDRSSTYDKNFITAYENVANTLDLKSDCAIKTGLAEDDDKVAEAGNERADFGSKLVITDSYGHQTGILNSAKKNKNTHFISCTGDLANAANVEDENIKVNHNYHNAFAKIFEGRFLAGIVAGYNLKEIYVNNEIKLLNSNDELVIGYVGAFEYAEVKSGFTSFYLGVKYGLNKAGQETLANNLKMKVAYTNSWYDPVAEKNTAKALIESHGCKLISQHADSTGAPDACEEAKIPNVGYNISYRSTHPNTYLVSSRINWEPYFTKALIAIKNGETLETDWCGDLDTNSVQLCEYGAIVKEDARKAVEDATKLLKQKTLHVFDTSTYKVKGAVQTTKKASIKYGNYVKEYEAIQTDAATGKSYFDESNADQLRSAPYFDDIIDGIEEIKLS